MRKVLGLLIIVLVLVLALLVFSYDASEEFVSEEIYVYQPDLDLDEIDDVDYVDYSGVGEIVEPEVEEEEEDDNDQDSIVLVEVEYDDEEVVEEEDYNTYEDFSSYDATLMSGGDTFGIWEVVFAGGGYVQVVDEVLTMYPKNDETGDVHSALVVGDSFEGYFSTDFRTIEQLEDPIEYWHTNWLVWNYEDNDHFYYFILKENGYELGKRDPDYDGGQRFLVTGHEITLDIGEWNNFEVFQEDNFMEIYVDGVKVCEFLDEETPYTSGKVGFYTEDALVEIDNVIVYHQQ